MKQIYFKLHLQLFIFRAIINYISSQTYFFWSYVDLLLLSHVFVTLISWSFIKRRNLHYRDLMLVIHVVILQLKKYTNIISYVSVIRTGKRLRSKKKCLQYLQFSFMWFQRRHPVYKINKWFNVLIFVRKICSKLFVQLSLALL